MFGSVQECKICENMSSMKLDIEKFDRSVTLAYDKSR